MTLGYNLYLRAVACLCCVKDGWISMWDLRQVGSVWDDDDIGDRGTASQLPSSSSCLTTCCQHRLPWRSPGRLPLLETLGVPGSSCSLLVSQHLWSRAWQLASKALRLQPLTSWLWARGFLQTPHLSWTLQLP